MPLNSYVCNLLDIKDEPNGVRCIRLSAPSDFEFEAGQYVLCQHPDGDIPFSIVSAPHQLPLVELHFLPNTQLSEAQRMQALLQQDTLSLSKAQGDVSITRALRCKLLLIAGGTGITQARSLLSHLAQCQVTHQTRLVWSVNSNNDFYQLESLQDLATHPWFELDLLARDNHSQLRPLDTWFSVNLSAFRNSHLILSGSPDFVYYCADQVEAHNIPIQQIRSDVFAYAPRARGA